MKSLLNGDEAARELYIMLLEMDDEVERVSGGKLEIDAYLWKSTIDRAREIIAANKANALAL